MKILHIIVCLGVIGISSYSYAAIEKQEEPKKTQERLTNGQVLAELSDKELRLWVHGAFSGLGHGLINEKSKKGDCIWEWYFSGEDRFPTIKAAFKKYPKAFPSATIVAITDRVCAA